MKKAILTVLLLLLCAVCCAVGFAACKSDGKGQAHSEHVWGEWIEIPPTCDESGYMRRNCEECDAFESYPTTPATGHDWGEWQIDSATCDDDGLQYRQCNTCGVYEKHTINKTGHMFKISYWQWGDDGATAVFICLNNKNHSRFVEATVTKQTTKEPSYTEEGEIKYTATAIFEGETYTDEKTEIIPKFDPPYTLGLTYSEIKNGNEVVAYSVSGIDNATDTEITVPSTYNEKPVTAVSSRAFYGKNITKVVLPSSVTAIGTSAFRNCTLLTDITLPDSLQSIGAYAFSGSGLYEDQSNWVNSALYIGNHLIAVDTTVTGTVTVDDGTICIAEYAFQSCTNLAGIYIPESVASIGYSSIYGCTEIESITVDSNNKKYSGEGNCLIEISTKILIVGCKNTVIPTDGSVETIYERAFYNITGLNQAVIPDSVTSIGMYAYGGCSNLSQVTFGNKLVSIGYGAFYGCSNLTTLNLPASLTDIGDRAFYDCGGLESISVDSRNTVYSSAGNCLTDIANKTLLLGCSNSVIPADGSVTKIGNNAFFNCKKLLYIEIPDSVVTIGTEAFNGCGMLEEVVVGSGVTLIEEYAFFGCKMLSMATFKVASGWSWYKTSAGTGTAVDMANSANAAVWLISYNYIFKRA